MCVLLLALVVREPRITRVLARGGGQLLSSTATGVTDVASHFMDEALSSQAPARKPAHEFHEAADEPTRSFFSKLAQTITNAVHTIFYIAMGMAFSAAAFVYHALPQVLGHNGANPK